MMKKSLLSILFALCTLCLSYGQYSSAQYLKGANKAIEKKKYYSALINYSKAIELGETSPEIKYNYGISAYKAYAFGLAESALEDYISTDEGVDVASAMLTLADAKVALEKYDDAQKYYDLYLAEYADLDPVATARARKGKKSTKWAMKQTEKKGFEIEHLDRKVNSDYADVSPIVHNDKLYYSTFRFSTNDRQVNYAQIVTEKGGPLEETSNFNTDKENKLTVAPSFSKDGKIMFYALCEASYDQSPQCDLYYTKKSGKTFGDGVKLPESINVDGYSSTEPNLVDEGDGSYTLYFSSNRPGGKGQYDIWSTTMNSEMDFTAPMSVGGVNTMGNDRTPFYHSGTETIYFSSDGRNESFGGIDLYSANMTDGAFANVTNLGSPVNSPNDDRYFSLNEAGDEAYMVSNRKGSYYLDESFETCCFDIYRMDIALECEMIVNVTDCNSGIPLGGNVSVKDVKSGEVIYTGPISGAGKASVTINRNNEYEISVENDCYPSKTMNAGPFPDAEGDDCTTDVDMCLEGEAAQLEACTFDKKTGKELNGSEICLLDVASGEQDCRRTSPGNCTTFDIVIGKEYTLVGKKATYLDESITFNADCKDLKKDINLGKRPLTCMDTSFPMSLYFDNDEPRSKSKTYIETLDKYRPKREEYKRRYASDYGFKSDEREMADADVDAFFDELDAAQNKMNTMLNCILEYLQNGQNLTLELRGYASPIARDEYNEALSQRRVNSVIQSIHAFREGALKQYLDSGQLKLIEKPYGESQANESVSDSRARKNKSVYSPEAARERRVEIHRVNNN